MHSQAVSTLLLHVPFSGSVARRSMQNGRWCYTMLQDTSADCNASVAHVLADCDLLMVPSASTIAQASVSAEKCAGADRQDQMSLPMSRHKRTKHCRQQSCWCLVRSFACHGIVILRDALMRMIIKQAASLRSIYFVSCACGILRSHSCCSCAVCY